MIFVKRAEIKVPGSTGFDRRAQFLLDHLFQLHMGFDFIFGKEHFSFLFCTVSRVSTVSLYQAGNCISTYPRLKQ